LLGKSGFSFDTSYMNHMNWRDYFLALLLLALCGYGLWKCLGGFRRTRGSGTSKPYLYVLSMTLLLGIIALVLLVVVFEFVGPLH
jgi:H+/Cl- antiporter ClcA